RETRLAGAEGQHDVEDIVDLRQSEDLDIAAGGLLREIVAETPGPDEIGGDEQQQGKPRRRQADGPPSGKNRGPAECHLDENGIEENAGESERRNPVSQPCGPPPGSTCRSHVRIGPLALQWVVNSYNRRHTFSRNRRGRILQQVVTSLPLETTPEPAFELTVLVPVLNEEESIRPLIDRICEALKDYNKPWELLLVDDGSTDRTLLYARSYFSRKGLNLRIIEFQRNFGKASAYQAGFDAALGKYIATLDGDLQNDPFDIQRMIGELEERDLDLLAGWRKARQDAVILRKIPSFFANRLIWKVTGVHIHDNGCGLKLYRAS